MTVLASFKSPQCLQKAIVDTFINNNCVSDLIDTGSSDSFIHKKLIGKLNFGMGLSNSSVSMTELFVTVVCGYVSVDILIDELPTNKIISS